ncbi:MAG: PilN domain-containing protein [Desulfonatronovibrionaceae bacterium]
MIKINLLPHAKRAKASNTEKLILLTGIFLIMLSAGIFTTGLIWKDKIQNLEASIQEKQTLRQNLLKKVGRINRLEKEFEALKDNIAAIRDIRSRQQLPVRYVDEVVRAIPAERIWFEALNLGSDGTMDIRGIALDNQAFAGYVDELRQSPFIQRVTTRRTSRKRVSNLDLVEFQFQVSAGPASSGAQDEKPQDQ